MSPVTGGNLLLFDHAIIKISLGELNRDQIDSRPTLLMELEAVANAALVSSEQKTTAVLSFTRSFFFFGNFRSELHAPAHDPPVFDWNRWDASLQIVPWVCLPDMGSEWAAQLGVRLTLESEVVVPKYSKAQSTSILAL